MIEDAMLAELLAMVRRDDHQGVGQELPPLQFREQPAELTVEVADRAVIGVDRPLGPLGPLGIPRAPGAVEPGVNAPAVGRELPVPRRRRQVGPVRVVVVGEDEERLPLRAVIQPVEDAGGHFRGVLAAQVVVRAEQAPQGAVPRHRQRQLRVAEQACRRKGVILEPGEAARQPHLLAGVVGVGGEPRGDESVAGQHLRDRRHRILERDHPVGARLMGLVAGEEARMAGQGPRRGREGLLEARAGRREGVQVGTGGAGVAVHPQVECAHRVQHQQQDVRGPRGGLPNGPERPVLAIHPPGAGGRRQQQHEAEARGEQPADTMAQGAGMPGGPSSGLHPHPEGQDEARHPVHLREDVQQPEHRQAGDDAGDHAGGEQPRQDHRPQRQPQAEHQVHQQVRRRRGPDEVRPLKQELAQEDVPDGIAPQLEAAGREPAQRRDGQRVRLPRSNRLSHGGRGSCERLLGAAPVGRTHHPIQDAAQVPGGAAECRIGCKVAGFQ